jgi:BirA family biotin operon repressor/biotin-[acetyl-CoA-carboxylase] ligase
MVLRPTILRFDSLPSTNTEAARQALRGVPEGLCIVAREQTEGRGRQQRVWVSPVDSGLYFSIVLRPQLETSMWPLVTLMAALAVADALRDAAGLTVDIKWPNDIYAENRKLCGILAETVETESGRACIVGVGINLKHRALPAELRDVATSVEALTGGGTDAESLLQALVRAIERRYGILQSTGGQERTISDWSARSSYAQGKRVRVSLAEEIFEGVTCGLEPDGALRVETGAGEIKRVRAGDVTVLRTSRERWNETADG